MTARKKSKKPQGRKKGDPKPPGSGRKKGTPNKVSADLKAMTLEALNELGGTKYMKWLAVNEPSAFCRLLARIIPQAVHHEVESCESLAEDIREAQRRAGIRTVRTDRDLEEAA